MIRLRAALGLALALAPGIAGGAAIGAELGERLTDPASGFTVRGPAGWTARWGAMEGVSLILLGPSHGGFTANLNVVVLPEAVAVTPRFVEDLARRLEARMRGGESGEGEGAAAPDYRVTRRRVAPVAGVDAAYLEAAFTRSGPAGAAGFRQLQILIPGAQEHYVLTYTAREEGFEASLPVIRAAVNSFTPGLGTAPAPQPPPWHGRPAVRIGIGLLAVVVLGLALRRRRPPPARGRHAARSPTQEETD